MKRRILLVGGGLAGLSCAVRLQEGGVEAIILEHSDAVGGRVRTDHHTREEYLRRFGFSE